VSADDGIGSGCRVAAEVDRHPTIVVGERGHELEAGAERFEVLAQRRHARVVGVLELGDRPLGHVEPAGELGLADRLSVTKLGQPDLLQRLGTQTARRSDAPGLATTMSRSSENLVRDSVDHHSMN
jgi:hypothetical protein